MNFIFTSECLLTFVSESTRIGRSTRKWGFPELCLYTSSSAAYHMKIARQGSILTQVCWFYQFLSRRIFQGLITTNSRKEIEDGPTHPPLLSTNPHAPSGFTKSSWFSEASIFLALPNLEYETGKLE